MRPDAVRSPARCARLRSSCPPGCVIEGLNDSKKLSEKKREKLFDEITENALAWSVSLVDERVIDEINILQATLPRDAAGGGRPDHVRRILLYVDGNRSQGLEHAARVRGRRRCKNPVCCGGVHSSPR